MKKTTQKHFSLIVKRDCPTCALLEPVAAALAARFGEGLRIYVQDDPSFLSHITGIVDDTELEYSYRHNIETVPTLIRLDSAQKETGRTHGWDKKQWRALTGIADLGAGLEDFKPGCGSKTCEPGMAERLALRYGSGGDGSGDANSDGGANESEGSVGGGLKSRPIKLGEAEDAIEACFARGWSDGLPVVPPTPLRVMRMLQATDRDPAEVIGKMPPDNADCSIEKIAVNAVLAGCKPEYLPLVITMVETALDDRFCLHGLLCTTYFSGPVVIVNGPATRLLGMNSGVNALGQGNRANATIGRALQLVVRNVGGGIPGGIDRATLGNPGKLSYCFAEDESDPRWSSLAEDQGFKREDSTVSLFAGDGLQGIMDQQSRTPESLAASMAASLRTVAHSKLFGIADAVLVVSPEHRRLFLDNGWNKRNLQDALSEHLQSPATDLLRGTGGIQEGMPKSLGAARGGKSKTLHKFRPGGLHIVTAGGSAGLFSAIIGGWVAAGQKGSQLVTGKL